MTPRPVPSRLLLLLLLLLVSVVLVASTTAANSSSSALDASSSSRNASGNTTSSPATVTVSFCALCRDQGKCDKAYHGHAGIFCGAQRHAVRGRIACCCPAGGVCLRVASAYDCACGDGRTSRAAAEDAIVRGQQDASNGGGGFHKMIWTVAAALVMGVLIAMYLYSTRSDRSYHYREPQRTTRTRDALPVTPPPAAVSAKQAVVV